MGNPFAAFNYLITLFIVMDAAVALRFDFLGNRADVGIVGPTI